MSALTKEAIEDVRRWMLESPRTAGKTTVNTLCDMALRSLSPASATEATNNNATGRESSALPIGRPKDNESAASTYPVAPFTAEMEAAGSRVWNKTASLAKAYRAMLAAAPAPAVASATEATGPTEAMTDACRQFLVYCETPGRDLRGARRHMLMAGASYESWPDWAKQDDGHITKSAMAAIVWYMMQSAAPACTVPEEKATHTWVDPRGPVKWPHCSVCGIIKRPDGGNGSCKGHPAVGPR